MGFLDSGSSTKQYNDAKNSAFSDLTNSQVTNLQGVTVSGKNGSSYITLTDNGATHDAFDFADKVSSQAYDYSRDLASSTAATVGAAVSAVSESARSETENIFINLQKYALYGGIVWGAVMIFKAVK